MPLLKIWSHLSIGPAANALLLSTPCPGLEDEVGGRGGSLSIMCRLVKTKHGNELIPE